MQDVYLYETVRSPRARARDDGALHSITPQELLAQLLAALQQRAGFDPAAIDDVILGCVTQAGDQAANIAKNATLYAGWPTQVPGITINRFCSSSVDAIDLAALKVASGRAAAVIAGGVEMMSRVPMLSDKATVFRDPGFAARCQMLMMGNGADLIASRAGISREQADALALLSQQRAAAARDGGHFERSLVAITAGTTSATVDECIRDSMTAEKLAALPAAFAEMGAAGVDALQLQSHPGIDSIDHIHTAGNSPAMADAAGLLLVASREFGQRYGMTPRAKLIDSTTVSADPLQVLTGCVEAPRRLLQNNKLQAGDVDLFEIHEAFAATVLWGQQELGIDPRRCNVNGGVIALGHPMGATGAIMTMALVDELERRDLSLGIVSAAGAAGTGSALLLRRCG